MTEPVLWLRDPLEYLPRCFKVLTKPDKRGNSDLVPLVLKPMQAHWIRNRSNMDWIVKPRQMGMSTVILAANSHKTFTEPYHRMAVVAHRGESAESMFKAVHRFLLHLPEDLKPEVGALTTTKMSFPKLDAFVHIDSAQSKAIGRSESLTLVHNSEVAQWPEQNATELWAGISQTVSPGASMTWESTPKGKGGFFYRMYRAVKNGDMPGKCFFYPWWWEPGYQAALAPKQVLTFDQEEAGLVKHFGLTPEQILWRRQKQAELKDLFYQEYPEDDVNCWLIGEQSVFDGLAIRRYLQGVRDGFQDGNLKVWKDVIGGRSYVIGADVGAGMPKGDFSAAVVIDGRSNEHVATYHARTPPDLFATDLLRLSRRYNDALLVVERNNHGHSVIMRLLENPCNLYYHTDYDRLSGQELSHPGFITSSKTKPVMIDLFAASLRAQDFITWDADLLQEAASYQYQPGSTSERIKAGAASGEYDDILMAAMMAEMVREQEPVLMSDNRHSCVESYAD